MLMKTVPYCMPFDDVRFSITGSERDRLVGRLEQNGGIFAPYLMEAMKRAVRPDFCCVDIGANIGLTALALGHFARNGTVYAFEPARENFRYLQLNLAQNRMANVFPINLGLYDQPCVLRFSFIERMTACSHISPGDASEGVIEQIDCTSLDEWMKANRIERLDFIKLDAEGSEVKVLNGATATISRFHPDLVVEFNPSALVRFGGDDPRALYDFLERRYPYLYLIDDRTHSLIETGSWKWLEKRAGAGKGWEDLYCTRNRVTTGLGARLRALYRRHLP